MSSDGGGIGWTLTSGIQDVAAILPLLGTEQCSVQVSSALTRGYLYAAASPMSIFGSLGVVTTGNGNQRDEGEVLRHKGSGISS